ncbi:hypothetical protein [Hyphomicrobium sp.]|uniref:hypothetical protein n=1 Tax=Hyphomicrobium sp. TaxID=82 RepID=UPI002B721902|nr:hypothetical protein [Hyphomicrobium sp.]HRN88782.1 hypothetical protein [Hyphomicrobium sp.]HRQ25674.1 hypothetical protein [Hyphomicrobium sp.]
MSKPFLMPFAASFLVMTALCSAATAFESYQVTGVKAGDTLTLRAEPTEGGKPSDWTALGSIPADAQNVLGTGRSVQINGQPWAEVSFGGVLGWVNAKFLAAMSDPPDLKSETFQCSGTEPFWGVTLGPEKGEYSDPEQSFPLTTERVQPSTARLFPLLYRLKDDKGRSYRATVTQRPGCIDGMSDYEYAFEVLLSGDENFEQGCCVVKR